MFSFCHHCGGAINQEQVVGQRLVCRSCKKEIGVVEADEPERVVDKTNALVQSGKVARCPECHRLVEIREKKGRRSMAPHMGAGPSRHVHLQRQTRAGHPQRRRRTATPRHLQGPFRLHHARIDHGHRPWQDRRPYLRAPQARIPRQDGPGAGADRRRPRHFGRGIQDVELSRRAQAASPGHLVGATRCVVARRHPQGGYETIPDADLPGADRGTPIEPQPVFRVILSSESGFAAPACGFALTLARGERASPRGLLFSARREREAASGSRACSFLREATVAN